MSHSISFVIPCLNEERTLPLVLQAIQEAIARDFHDRAVEVIVTDNGSTDRSIEIARSFGATVVACKQRGYGANLMNGFRHAKHDLIIFADADNSYNFQESYRLVQALEQEGCGMVLGSRYKGGIAKGAMPFIHRYLGTPVLNLCINFLYGKKGKRISDCNSGFRCFRREILGTLALQSSGMEFASEMIISVFQNDISIAEAPISLAPDGRDRAPSLKTWRDGMRHLLQILAGAPQLFFWSGLGIWSICVAIIALGTLKGVIVIGAVRVFGIHTTLIAVAGSVAGLQVWNIGVFTSTLLARSTSGKIYRRLRQMAEGKLFLILCLFLLYAIGSAGWIIYRWHQHDYQFLAIETELVLIISLFIAWCNVIASLIAVHLTGRTMKHEAPE